MNVNLILVLHGAIQGNFERRYIGQTINLPLSDRGKRDLLERKARGIYPPADTLYVSPLIRCVETAHLLYPMLVPVTLNSLAELDFGSFEGKTYDQLKDDPSYRRWTDTAGMVAPPGGESGQEFTQRLSGAMRKIADDAVSRSFRTAVVVTHGGCITALMKQHLPQTGTGYDDIADYHAASGGGWRIEMDTEALVFRSVRPI